MDSAICFYTLKGKEPSTVKGARYSSDKPYVYVLTDRIWYDADSSHVGYNRCTTIKPDYQKSNQEVKLEVESGHLVKQNCEPLVVSVHKLFEDSQPVFGLTPVEEETPKDSMYQLNFTEHKKLVDFK